MRILVVEDEKRMANTLKDILRHEDFLVDISYDGQTGLDNAESGIYDIMILDIMLPKIDGITVLKKLRKNGNDIPVLLLTAKSTVDDKVTGLNNGADYYLTKPFSPKELVACIHALLRRPQLADEKYTQFADISFDPLGSSLCCGNRSINLSAREKTIMEILFSSNGRITPKETLITKVYGYDSDATDNNIESFISLLRRKLKFIGSTVTIQNERMLGYKLMSH